MNRGAGPYSPQELMVAVASREIHDGDLVFVGMRLPILAYAVARNTHAPGARGLFEVGLMRDQPASAFLGTMGDPPNVVGALWATRMSNAMALMSMPLNFAFQRWNVVSVMPCWRQRSAVFTPLSA